MNLGAMMAGLPKSERNFVRFGFLALLYASCRALRVATADGPRWIRCADAHLVWVSKLMMWRLPPLLQGLMTASHVVGVAEIDSELVWLVDVKRFFPTWSGG